MQPGSTQSPAAEFDLELQLLDVGYRRFAAVVRRTSDRSKVIELRRAFHGFPYLWKSVRGRDVLICTVDSWELAYVDPYAATVTKSPLSLESPVKDFVAFHFFDAGDSGLLGITGAIPVSPAQLAVVSTDFGENPARDELVLFDFDLCEFEGWTHSKRCVWTRHPNADSLVVARGSVDRSAGPWIEEDESIERVAWVDDGAEIAGRAE
jgi:hypothetical protein